MSGFDTPAACVTFLTPRCAELCTCYSRRRGKHRNTQLNPAVRLQTHLVLCQNGQSCGTCTSVCCTAAGQSLDEKGGGVLRAEPGINHRTEVAVPLSRTVNDRSDHMHSPASKVKEQTHIKQYRIALMGVDTDLDSHLWKFSVKVP